MLSFKDFIVEMFGRGDSPLPFRYIGPDVGRGNKHYYDFVDDNKNKYAVQIRHEPDMQSAGNRVANIQFFLKTRDGHAQEKMGHAGAESSRVFSTVKQIASEHAKKHGVDNYVFTGTDDENSRTNSRQRLYDKIARRLGGSSSRVDSSTSSYSIPTNMDK
jgi:hypothetical protein